VENRASRGALAALLLAVAAVLSCQSQSDAPVAENKPLIYVDADGGNPGQLRDSISNPFPHMLFSDGQVSINDRCPVRKAPLNLKLPGLYVNGRPIGFC